MKRIRSPILLLLFLLLSVWGKSQYLGGDGNGSFTMSLTQASCSSPAYPSIFAGGDENGAALALVQQASCSAVIMPSVFSGGNESSSSSALLSQVSCNIITYPSIFTGGVEASDNAFIVPQVSCASVVYPSIFTGGADDGFSGTPAIQVACITPADPGIYAGGSSNVTTGVTFLTACAPYAEFEADTQIVCEGDTVFFTDLSLGGPTAWSWSFEGGTPLGSSLQNPFVIYNTVGTYQVQLQITAPNGNSTELKTGYIVVGASPSATITASGPTSFCEGDSVQLTVNPVYPSYAWNTGQTAQSVYASASGNYYSVVTAANGCTANTDTITVNVLTNPVPLVTTNGPTTLCNADTLTLTSSPGTSYIWLPGSETTQTLEVTASGTYYVSVTYPNGCSNVSAPVNAVFGTTPATPVITPSGPLIFCSGDSVVLTSSPASSYFWNPGSTNAQTIIVKNSGTFYVETGNGTGCTAMSLPVTVTVLSNTPAPVITASGPLAFCSGDSVVLTSSPAASYNWSPGAQTTQSITVHTSGTYFIEADNGNNCPSVSTPVVVSVASVPATPTIGASGPLTFCAGGNVVLTASAAGSYLWSPGGQTTQSITVSVTGNYYVETGNGTGCTASSTPVAVTVNAIPATPVVSASGPLTFCNGSSVTLTSTAATSYYWYPNGETTQSITVSASGNYYVETGNGTGCTASATPVSVTVNAVPTTPTISASGPLAFCAGGNVVLTASAAGSYLWSPGGQTTQSITVSATGNYYVETGNGTGCTASSTPVVVTVNAVPSTPVVSASGPLTFCNGSSVTLTSTAATSYYWYPNGETTQSISVSATGNYYVETGNGTGCTASATPVSVTVNAVPATPTISASGPLTFCAGDNVVLTSSAAGSYLWSPGGQTTQSITVSATGNYYVETGNGTGCTASSTPVAVTVNAVPSTPVVSASGPLTFCNGSSVTLTSTAATSYYWYPNGETTQSISVNTSGNYYVETGNGTGCTASSTPVSVTVNAVPATPTIGALGPLTFCAGGNVVLTASAAGSYLWSPGGQTTQSITVSATGNYYVETGNGTGCTASSTPVVVTVNAVPSTPVVSASGPLTFCNGSSVTLTSTAATSYYWYPNGETTQSISVSATGNYYVETGNGTGCTASATPVSVTVNAVPATPTIGASGPLTFCAGGNVVLTASAAVSYLWSPGGQTTQSITVSATGNYYVETGNGTGCTASSTPVSVTVNAVPVTPVVSASGPLSFCDGDSVVLTASASAFYQWYPGGQTTQSITVIASGNYYVETGNGSCSAQSTTMAVTVLPRPAVPVVSASGPLAFCDGDSVVLISSLADAYEWNPSGGTSQSLTVTASGTYFIEVTNASGCSNSSVPVTVTVNPNPVVNLTGPAVACLNTTENFTATNLGGVSYFWTTGNGSIISGSGTNTVSVLFPDTGQALVEVIVSDLTTSCFSQAEISLLVLNAPEAYAGADLSVCQGSSVQLQAFGGTTYSWTPPAGLSDPDIANPLASPVSTTSYIVEVANGSCTDVDTVLVTVYPIPAVDAGSDVYISEDSCVVLAGSGIGSVLWTPAYGLSESTTLTPTACPDTTVTYYLTVTGAGGCFATDSVTVYVSASGDELVFPNTFTPNADGTNDIWHISGLEQYPDHRLTVFNRWGNQVFDAEPYENNWDGTSLGRELPDGTYFFVFDKGNGEELLKGFLMIIR